ncbi:MAG: STAS domain-containing protein [Treponema sp.]|nr:STAS domain-containing protein [Treponema sp.]
MRNEDLEITEETTMEGIKLTIKGHVNSGTADKLENWLHKAIHDGQKNIVLNMLWVKFLSSAGIRVILKTYQDLNDTGGRFGIEMPSQNVRNVLGMTALDEMLIK